MPGVDMPVDELERYAPVPNRPSDFSRFWEATLAELALVSPSVEVEPISSG